MIRNFFNGVQTNSWAVTGAISADTHRTSIGAYNGDNDSGICNWINGIVDEVRAEQVFRSTNWIWATYLTVASTTNFCVYGSVQANSGGTNYTITASAGSNGSIVPSGAVSVPSGSNQTFAIAGNSGYIVTNVVVDGSSVGATNSYTFINVTAGHTINAFFGAIVVNYTITASAIQTAQSFLPAPCSLRLVEARGLRCREIPGIS